MAKAKVTVRTFTQMKEAKEKIAVLTAYDFFTARILDQIGIDCLLVGDSADMVFYGSKTTLSIGMDQMIYHTRAVSSACEKAMVVGDMPFLSYQTSESEAIRNAGRFLKEGGAQAVKIEGGTEMIKIVSRCSPFVKKTVRGRTCQSTFARSSHLEVYPAVGLLASQGSNTHEPPTGEYTSAARSMRRG